MPFTEVKGAVHVHSNLSDGSGTVSQIAAAAAAARIDYVVLTDHDSTGRADRSRSGRYGGVLLVVGSEVSPRGGGHCVAIGAEDVHAHRWMPERYYLRRLKDAGADVYIAHPEGRIKRSFGIRLGRWPAWESEDFAGIEIWSYMHDWVANLNLFNLPLYYLRPAWAIKGPNPRVLALWDNLNLSRRVVGIGALDAHAVKLAGGLFVAFRYEYLFRTVLTHALVGNWGASPREDAESLREALRAGRAFAAYDLLAPAGGFAFEASGGLQMGGRAPWTPGATVTVGLPREAEVRLVRDGRQVFAGKASRVEFPAGAPGVYRAEAWLSGKPWIFSNPITLLGP